MNIRVESDLKNVQTFLSGLNTRLSDLSPFWRNYVAPYTYDAIGRIFDTQGHGQWDALNPIYAARKAITHPGQPILRRDDAYYQAATGPGHSDSVANIDPLMLVLGVETEYAAYHEEGRGVPQRQVYHLIPQMLGFEADLSRLGEDYERDIIRVLGG